MKWSNEEVSLLIKNKEKDINELQEIFPDKTKCSIQSKSQKIGLNRLKYDFWIKEEDEFLLKNKDKKIEKILKFFPNRTRKSIVHRRQILNISNKRKTWKNEEVEILKKQSSGKTLNELYVLLPNKSESAILNKITRLKLYFKHVKKNWSENEEIILKKNSKEKSIYELQKILSQKSISSIRNKLHLLKLDYKHFYEYWTEEEKQIIKNCWSEKSAKELQEKIPNRSVDSINEMAQRLKVYKSQNFWINLGKKYLGKPLPPRYKLDQNIKITDLSNETYQVLIGSILGDGCIKKQNKNRNRYIFSEDHSIKQLDYLQWKKEMLKELSPSNVHNLKAETPNLTTPSHEIFKILRNDFYNEEKKKKSYIKPGYVKKLNALGLLIWYLDDGYKEGKNGGAIGSTLFSYSNLGKTIKILNKNLNLSLYLRFSEKEQRTTIVINSENFKKIIPTWKKLVIKYNLPKCMWYKLNMD